MITDLILYIIYSFLWLITLPVRAFADVSMPSQVLNAVATLNGYLGGISQIFPTGTLIAVFALLLIAEGSVIAYKVIRWVYQKIPGVN